MLTMTLSENAIFYKFNNLCRKYPEVTWSIRELARRWNMSVGIVHRAFKKLQKMGLLTEVIIHSRLYVRSLVAGAVEKFKSLSKKRHFRERYVNDSVNDNLKEKGPPINIEVNNKNINTPLPPQGAEGFFDEDIDRERKLDLLRQVANQDKLGLTVSQSIKLLGNNPPEMFKKAYNETLAYKEKGGYIHSSFCLIRHKLNVFRKMYGY